MPPVSVTMQCVINLAVQYFLIYTAVVIVRTMNDLNGVKHSSSPMLATLQAATGTVAYAPMLCVLFLGTPCQNCLQTHDLSQACPSLSTCFVLRLFRLAAIQILELIQDWSCSSRILDYVHCK